jgi:aminopeptidase N
MRTETGQVYKLKDYKPTDFVVERIDLTFELDPKGDDGRLPGDPASPRRRSQRTRLWCLTETN